MTASYTFFEGNDGTQDNLGSINISPGKNYDLLASNAPIDNDEARSVVLNKGVKQGSALVVYDSPVASMDDDWCVIQVKEAITENDGYTVDSFEQDKTTSNHIYQNYHSDNGLDGKVSYISIYAPWPGTWPVPPSNNGIDSTTLFNHKPSNAAMSATNLEPSGLTLVGNKLYMVSDNGGLAMMDLDYVSQGWRTQAITTTGGDEYGLEAIAYVGGMLMLGVEGADEAKNQSNPQILCFDPSLADPGQGRLLGELTTSCWTLVDDNLDNNAGMESMTFVPADFCPSSWGTPSSGGYGGFFLVGLQSTPAEIRVYDLPRANGGEQFFPSPTTTISSHLLNLKLSDLCFDASTGKLYVMYDDKVDAMQIFSLSKSGGMSFVNQTMPPVWPANTPQAGEPVKNCEGLTVKGSTVYLALDQNDNSIANYVFKLSNFSVDS